MSFCQPTSSPGKLPPGQALWDCVSEPVCVAVHVSCDDPAGKDPDAKMRENRWFKEIEKILKERNVTAGPVLLISMFPSRSVCVFE